MNKKIIKKRNPQNTKSLCSNEQGDYSIFIKKCQKW